METIVEISPSEIKDGVVYIGFGLDLSYDNPNWNVICGTNEEDVKKEIIESGWEPVHSFVVKVKVADVSNVKKTIESIRTIDLTHEGETKVVQ